MRNPATFQLSTFNLATFQPSNLPMRFFLFSICLLLSLPGRAQDGNLYWKYKDYDGAIAFTVPGVFAKIGSLFVKDKDMRRLLRHTGKTRILVFEDKPSPVSERDLNRLARQTRQSGGLDDLIFVRDGDTRVQVMGKVGEKKLRKLVFLVNEPGTFAFISVKGRFRYDDINRIIQRHSKDALKKGKKPKVPMVVKPPVDRV